MSKRRAHRVMSGGTRNKLGRVPSPWGHTGCAVFPGSELGHAQGTSIRESSLEIQCPLFPLEAGQIGSHCSAHTTVPGSEKDSNCSAWTLLLTQCWHSEPPPHSGDQLAPSPDLSGGPALQAGLSEDSSLRASVLAPFPHLY